MKNSKEGDGGTETETHFNNDRDTDTHTDPHTDTDTETKLTWISIAGGTFNMGSTEYPDEQPVHSVTVSDFEILETEVTVAQYGACVTAGSCSVPGNGDLANWRTVGRENHPVNYVDWNQAVFFCTWAGGRLPSEAEWEYAARNGRAENIYPWGDETATCDYAVMVDDTHADGCDVGHSWEVCSKTKGNTSHGLCDMAGNVREWVQDWYHSSYTGAPDDGSAWEAPVGSARIARGGSFHHYAAHVRAANRADDTPSGQFNYLGFRCAREAP